MPLWPLHLARVSPRVWLALLVTLSLGASFGMAELRVIELQTTTWDLGIYQQALWSTAHGRAFYETPDLETGGFGSFLQVHSAFLLYLVVPIYAAVPSEETLLLIQSFVVAIAALPLGRFARQVTGSPWLGLASSGVYLAWGPLISSTLYDFHVESLIPLEVFSFLLFWQERRYLFGVVTAAIAFGTMEIMPILLFFVALFFLLPEGPTLQEIRRKIRSHQQFFRPIVRELGRALRSRHVQLTLALLLACVVAYFTLLWLRENALSSLLGVNQFPLGAPGRGYVIGGNLEGLGLSLSYIGIGLREKLFFWLLYLVLLGFLPLLAPRALILALPWAAFTFLSNTTNYVALGFQYGFIVAALLMPSFVFGLRRLEGILFRWYDPEKDPSGDKPPSRVLLPDRCPPHIPRPTRSLTLAILLLVATNLLVSPLDPVMQGGDLGSSYRVSYGVSPGFSEVERIASLIPPNGGVLATDTLFPLVANDLQAYSLAWFFDGTLALPYDSAHLPPYVFLSETRTYTVPTWLDVRLYNGSDYGVRAIAWSTPVGAVVLFQKGFRGAPLELPQNPSFSGSYSGGKMQAGPAGYVTTLASGAPQIMESYGGEEGLLWSGPGVNLPQGNYSVTLWLRALVFDPTQGLSDTTPVLFVNSNAFALPSLFQDTLTFGQLNGSQWMPIRFNASLGEPTLQINTNGYVLNTNVIVEMDGLIISEHAKETQPA